MRHNFIQDLRPKNNGQLLVFLFMLNSLANLLYLNINTTLGNAISLCCFIIFIICILKHFKLAKFSGLIGFLFYFLILWSCAISFRTFFMDYGDLYSGNLFSVLQKIFSTPLFVPCQLPFLVFYFFQKKYFDIPYFIRVSVALALLCILFSPFSIHSILTFNFDLNYYGDDGGGYQDFIQNASLGIESLTPPIILIYFKKYITKWDWTVCLIAILISVLILALMARRGALLVNLTYLLAAYLLYILNTKKNRIRYIVYFIFISLVVFLFIQSKGNDIFSLLVERGDEDTRSGVEYNFYKDMDFDSWIFGRGWFGTYYDQIFGSQRYAIETGYLSLILRGGLLYLIPYVLVITLSAIKGLFKSNNLMIKSFAIVMIISVLELKPYGWPAFDLKYFIVWLGVYLCNTKQYRLMSESQIEKLFK